MNNFKIKNKEHLFINAKFLIIIDIHGMTAEQLKKLRKIINDSDAFIRVIKNTTLKRTFNESIFKPLIKQCTGQIAVLWENKNDFALVKIAEKNTNLHYIIKSGFYNCEVLSKKQIKYFAGLPSLLSLRKKITQTISLVMKKIIFLLKYHIVLIIKYINFILGKKKNV